MFGCIAALAALAITLFVALQAGWDLESSFQWLKPRENDIYYKKSYTVSDGKANRKREDVIASMEGSGLTNGQLQIYYWMQVYGFLENYADSSAYLGLDVSKPLDEQLATNGTATWQQYFLESALQVWQSNQAFAILAQENGYKLPAESQEYLDNLMESLEKKALEEGYADADAMIRQEMGAGCSARDYVEYMQVYYLGYQYFTQLYSAIEPTMEQIQAYYGENASKMSDAGYGKDAGSYVDVRHILIAPSGGTILSDGSVVYSDEAWDACRAEAEAVLALWEAGNWTLEEFIALVAVYSDDQSTNYAGGLYADIVKGDMEESFNSWCFSADRKPGDYGLVKTRYGYHILYFVEAEDIWLAESRSALIRQEGQKLVDEVLSRYEMTVDYKKIVLAEVSLQS